MVLDKNTDILQLKEFIDKNEVVFAKPNHGDQGKGVLKIQSNNVNAINNLIELSKQQPYVVDGLVENDKIFKQ